MKAVGLVRFRQDREDQREVFQTFQDDAGVRLEETQGHPFEEEVQV